MHAFRFLPLIALGAAMAGCSTGPTDRGMTSVHQPVVALTNYVLDIPAPTAGLAADDARRLNDWLGSLELRYGDRVSVDTQGYGPSARNAVADVAGAYGLLIDENPPVTQGTITPGYVRVIVSRMTASVPGCPSWTKTTPTDANAGQSSNFGCATNASLAAMIADPRDLISGRTGPSSVDATLSTKAIQTYRKAPSTGANGLKSESTKGN